MSICSQDYHKSSTFFIKLLTVAVAMFVKVSMEEW